MNDSGPHQARCVFEFDDDGAVWLAFDAARPDLNSELAAALAAEGRRRLSIGASDRGMFRAMKKEEAVTRPQIGAGAA